MTSGDSVSVEFLDALYAGDPDPWRFETSSYEAAKYAKTLKALPRSHYSAGLEVGCSIGVLTERLAARCTALTAIDPVQSALDRARARTGHLSNIEFKRRLLPRDGLSGQFDLILLSEILYFLSLADLRSTAELLVAHAIPGADIVMANWLPDNEYSMSGEAAAEAFIEAVGARAEILSQSRNENYRLDVLRLG